jgi:hypothetical protein
MESINEGDKFKIDGKIDGQSEFVELKNGVEKIVGDDRCRFFIAATTKKPIKLSVMVSHQSKENGLEVSKYDGPNSPKVLQELLGLNNDQINEINA